MTIMLTMDHLTGEAAVARRDLRREEMARFGGRIAWLQDPSLIPEAATRHMDHIAVAKGDGYFGLGMWMADQLSAWSGEVHGGLDFGATFEKRQLPNNERVAVRDAIREAAKPSYGTGIMAMSEIFGVVPPVASREGVTDPKDWSKIASQARNFGRALSFDGSNALAYVRAYLNPGDHVVARTGTPHVDPSLMRLDEELGITTVTDLEAMMAVAKEVANADMVNEGHAGTCVAPQAVPLGDEHGSMYDLVWDAYGFAIDRYVYPFHKPAEADMAGPAGPDNDLGFSFRMVGMRLMAEFIEAQGGA